MLFLELLEDRRCPSTLAELAGISPPGSDQPQSLLAIAQQFQHDNPAEFAMIASSPEALVHTLTLHVPPAVLDFGGVFPPDSSPLNLGTVTGVTVPTENLVTMPQGQPQKGIAVFDPATAIWYFRDSISPGAPTTAPFAYGEPGWIPVMGDWDGDGHTSIGVFDPQTAMWYLRNENSPGAPDAGTAHFGGVGWMPRVGPWDGIGRDRIGGIDPQSGTLTQAHPGGVWTVPGAVPLPTQNVLIGGGMVDLAINEWLLAGHSAFRYGAPGWLPFLGAF